MRPVERVEEGLCGCGERTTGGEVVGLQLQYKPLADCEKVCPCQERHLELVFMCAICVDLCRGLIPETALLHCFRFAAERFEPSLRSHRELYIIHRFRL